jgi:hypothetical protein
VQAYDRSGNGNRGILTNGPVRGIGKIGQGLSFDGADDTVQIDNATPLNLTTAVTVSVWIKPREWTSAAGTTDSIVDKAVHETETGYGLFQDGSGGQMHFRVSMAGPTALDVTITQPATGLWHHIVGSYDTINGVRTYLNGILRNTTAAGGSLTTNSDVLLTGDVVGHAYEFNGLIDDVRIYNRALSADEIKRLYNMGR